MCGIIGIVSKKQVVDRLIDGLECLEYRGYDSAGIATVNNSEIVCTKSTGKLFSLKNKLKQNPIDGYVGIGHTRWATHGEPVENNAHPHVTKNVAVVHNGIIENFAEFKDVLLEKGISFESQTDTEVIAQLYSKLLTEQTPIEALMNLFHVLILIIVCNKYRCCHSHPPKRFSTFLFHKRIEFT